MPALGFGHSRPDGGVRCCRGFGIDQVEPGALECFLVWPEPLTSASGSDENIRSCPEFAGDSALSSSVQFQGFPKGIKRHFYHFCSASALLPSAPELALN